MDHFTYQHGLLHAESVNLQQLAEEIGTPFYCYSTATLTRHYTVFHDALKGVNPLICFAVKANANQAVLKTLGDLGSGADVVSEGEIRRALAAGIPAEKIVFSGVGKTREEMAYALEQNILQFNVESQPELEALNDVALSQNNTASVAIRVNPDVDAETHAKISTGRTDNKFGIPMEQALPLYDTAAQMKGIDVQGVSMHIGSQLTSLVPFEKAYKRVHEFIEQLRTNGHDITTLDLGGGLGVPYDDKANPPLPVDYGALVKDTVGDLGCRLIFEPGRMIVANAGILVSRIIYVKPSLSKTFLIIDAAMNDLLRPSLYDAYHEIVPICEPKEGAQSITYDVVGPVCESGDTFAEARSMPKLQAGELVAFRSAGAYGAVMSNSYNSRLLTPEVLANGDAHSIIRQRQTYETLLGLDSLADWQD